MRFAEYEHFVSFTAGNGSNVEPRMFAVAVNVRNQSIDVEPQYLTPPRLFDSNTAFNAPLRVNNLASVLSTKGWHSNIGGIFLHNIGHVKARDGAGYSTILRVVSITPDSILDSLISSISVAQMMVFNDTQVVVVEARGDVFVIGNRVYIYAILALNILVTAVYIIEAVRARLWSDAARFNPLDVREVI
jgi:hypothetical protein